MKHEKSCGAVVLQRERNSPDKLNLLVIRHYAGGQISFPKGHVEAGETETMTAEREVLEETAVRIKIEYDFRETVSYNPMPGVEKEVVYFMAFTDAQEAKPRLNEIAEVFWIDALDAERRLSHENDKKVLRAALAYLARKGELAD